MIQVAWDFKIVEHDINLTMIHSTVDLIFYWVHRGVIIYLFFIIPIL